MTLEDRVNGLEQLLLQYVGLETQIRELRDTMDEMFDAEVIVVSADCLTNNHVYAAARQALRERQDYCEVTQRCNDVEQQRDELRIQLERARWELLISIAEVSDSGPKTVGISAPFTNLKDLGYGH